MRLGLTISFIECLKMAANVKQQLAQLANLSHSKDVIEKFVLYLKISFGLNNILLSVLLSLQHFNAFEKCGAVQLTVPYSHVSPYAIILQFRTQTNEILCFIPLNTIVIYLLE